MALLLTKLLVVLLRASDGIGPPLSFAAPFVLLYQDAWVVLAFAGLDLGAQRFTRPADGTEGDDGLSRAGRIAARIAFGVGLALVVYSAINIPITRLFSTPLTASM